MPHTSAEDRRTYQREYRQKRALDPVFRAYIAEQARDRYAADPSKRQAIEKRYVSAHPKKVAVRHSAWRAKNALKMSVYGYRARGWKIDERLLADLITDNCFYCGAAPNPVNGVDRVDSLRGYEYDNVVTACRRCNVAKLDQTVSEFSVWLDHIEAHRKGAAAWH